MFSDVDSAFDAFSREMKAMDLWNNVTLIQTLDFARTLNPNGGDGTDHAWGGNYMMMGKFLIRCRCCHFLIISLINCMTFYYYHL